MSRRSISQGILGLIVVVVALNLAGTGHGQTVLSGGSRSRQGGGADDAGVANGPDAD